MKPKVSRLSPKEDVSPANSLPRDFMEFFMLKNGLNRIVLIGLMPLIKDCRLPNDFFALFSLLDGVSNLFLSGHQENQDNLVQPQKAIETKASRQMATFPLTPRPPIFFPTSQLRNFLTSIFSTGPEFRMVRGPEYQKRGLGRSGRKPTRKSLLCGRLS